MQAALARGAAGLWRPLALGALLTLSAVPLAAETVRVTITAQPADGAEEAAVSWSAVPLDLPEGADVLQEMILTPEALRGAWQVDLPPGRYLISGFTENGLYEATALVTAQTQMISVPELSVEAAVALRCDQAGGCPFSDPQTGLSLTVPQGWALERPYRADQGDGTLSDAVSAVIYEDSGDEGGAVWFLNPVDWVEEEAAPCREVSLGLLCTFEPSGAAEAAFAQIAPSLAVAPAP